MTCCPLQRRRFTDRGRCGPDEDDRRNGVGRPWRCQLARGTDMLTRQQVLPARRGRKHQDRLSQPDVVPVRGQPLHPHRDDDEFAVAPVADPRVTGHRALDTGGRPCRAEGRERTEHPGAGLQTRRQHTRGEAGQTCQTRGRGPPDAPAPKQDRRAQQCHAQQRSGDPQHSCGRRGQSGTRSSCPGRECRADKAQVGRSALRIVPENGHARAPCHAVTGGPISSLPIADHQTVTSGRRSVSR